MTQIYHLIQSGGYQDMRGQVTVRRRTVATRTLGRALREQQLVLVTNSK